MMAYVDTSVIVRRLFSEPGGLPDHSSISDAVVSRLLFVEIARVIDRTRSSARLSDEQVAALHAEARRVLLSPTVIPVTESVLDLAARPMPTSLGTLDAIHLASAMLAEQEIGRKLVFATHDERLGLAARASGFDVIGC